jgi:hypothetical protein
MVRQGFEVLTFTQADEADRRYWWGRSPLERVRHLEYLRELNYGSEVIDQGLQRVLAVAERPSR